jgi:hypothetical protein
VRQLAAAAGDGPLGFAGSPGQLETSLNSGYTVGPCNSYLEGPTLASWGLLLAQSRLGSAASSLAEEERLCSLLLRAAVRDLPTLAAHVTAPSPTRAAIPTLAAHVPAPSPTGAAILMLEQFSLATPPLPNSCVPRASFVEAAQQSRSLRQH